MHTDIVMIVHKLSVFFALRTHDTRNEAPINAHKVRISNSLSYDDGKILRLCNILTPYSNT